MQDAARISNVPAHAARLPASIWESHLSQRLVDRRGWALLLSTPRGCDWFYELFQSGERGDDPAVESWASDALETQAIGLELGALCALGRSGEARQRSAVWARNHPDRPLDARARTLCW